MKRRDVLKTALAGATALAAPRIVQAEGAKTITFTPHADLASLDPVWTTADITRLVQGIGLQASKDSRWADNDA
jgi:peptide/nickel transport system substrate-binding protein